MRTTLLIVALALSAALIAVSVESSSPITREMVASAEKLLALSFSESKRDSMLDGLSDQRKNIEAIRSLHVPNNVPPALLFNPLPVGFAPGKSRLPFRPSSPRAISVPENLEDLAFASVGELGLLLKKRRVTSEQLTRMYIARLRRLDPELHCVVTLTEELALAQARRADAELAAGKYRGPLQGIPYGAKDLLATRGVRTTWGSVPFKEQQFGEDATVIHRLEDAGAVLVAKLSMGELAWGDVWFGGKTRNPWDTSKGSSGSSAGSASATAAGLVAFAIGTETWGSIVSPSTVCGTTGLRPTFGRVSRHGAMALAWSMDKIGPICRTVEDCALVFNAIYGPDGKDQSVIDAPFNYDHSIDLHRITIGYLKADFDSMPARRREGDSTLALLRTLGATLVPMALPHYPANDLSIILSAEAGAAFEELTRDGRDDQLVRQIKDAWPNVFRLSRFIPAVEYIQANRVRYELIQEMQTVLSQVDLYVAPSLEGDNLLVTNLTGHPCVVLPNGFTEEGVPTSISFTGRLFDEGRLLAVAKRYQDATTFHLRHPALGR